MVTNDAIKVDKLKFIRHDSILSNFAHLSFFVEFSFFNRGFTLALGRIVAGLPSRPWLRPLLQVHDELVFEVPEDKVSEAVTFVKTCMEAQPFDEFDVPIVADAAIGARFGELKELEDAL
jgi:hypothetical protein